MKPVQVFSCRCPVCGYEWIYVPRKGEPKKQVKCPKCGKMVTRSKCCKPIA